MRRSCEQNPADLPDNPASRRSDASEDQSESVGHLRLSKRALGLLFFLIVLIGFGLRVRSPEADPPPWSYVFSTDEGHYSYCAHTRLKHGQWFVNEAKYGLFTPLFSAIQYVIALLIPVSSHLVRLRLVSILAGTATCAAAAFFPKPAVSRLFVSSLLAVSFLAVVHARMGIPETVLVLMLQIAVLTAWHAYRDMKRVAAFLAGTLAFACFAVKPSGFFAIPMILAVPFLHPRRISDLLPAWLWCCGGVLAGLATWLCAVVLPDPAAWLEMTTKATAYGRSAMPHGPFAAIRSAFYLILSPGMQMLPASWALALAWCGAIYPVRMFRNEHTVFETLLFLWMAFAFIILGLPSYQPARWQVILLPPVLCAAQFFLSDLPGRRILIGTTVLGLTISFLSSFLIWGQFLDLSGKISPGYGPLAQVTVLLICVTAALLGGFTAAKLHLQRWLIIATAIFAGELAQQVLLHSAYPVRSHRAGNQWARVKNDLNRLAENRTVVLAGDLAQDLSLRCDIRTLPTYYVLSAVDDKAIREFFAEQNCMPTHFALLDASRDEWLRGAPRFMDGLTEIGTYRLTIGGLGPGNLRLYEIMKEIRRDRPEILQQ